MTEKILRLPLGDKSPSARLLYGVDVRDGLRMLESESVHCVVTSPPYWALRDYGTAQWVGGDPTCDHMTSRQAQGSTSARAGRSNVDTQRSPYRAECGKCGACRVDLQVGLEDTPEAYVEQVVEVFREVKRVLRPEGTVWLNLGDSYTSGGRSGHGTRVGYKQQTNRGMNGTNDPVRPPQPDGLKPKDLVGIPWMVAFALRADGWWLRSDVIWQKANSMPESVTDRPGRSHEYVFLLTRSESYYYDHVAVRVGKQESADGGRNLRSVWNIPTQPYPGAHFAVMPGDLVETCVKAGTSERGCCPKCKSPWERETKRTCGECGAEVPAGPKECPGCGDVRDWKAGRVASQDLVSPDFSTAGRGVPRLPGGFTNKTVAKDWAPTCGCPVAPPVPCTVLDPFSGSATVGMVSLALGRAYVGTDLNEGYLPLAEARIVGNKAPEKDSPPVTSGSALDIFGGDEDG